MICAPGGVEPSNESRSIRTPSNRPTSPTTSHWKITVTERPSTPTKDLSTHPSTPPVESIDHSKYDTPIDGPDETFRLLDLPAELQSLVIRHALGGLYDITLNHERISMLRSIYRIVGISASTLPLLLTSHHIHNLTSPIRHTLFTGRLILNSVFILVPLRRQARFEWLRTHTRILHFSDSSVHPERWGRYFDTFEGLKTIEIEFPIVKKLDHAVKLDDVLGGKEDQRLVGCLDRFMISLLGGYGLEFWITARFALKEGLGDWDGVVVSNVFILVEG